LIGFFFFLNRVAGCWRFTPVILTTQETEIRRKRFKTSPGKQFMRPYLKKKKNLHNKGLVKWLKV
jgi:hypothetical protein